MKLVGVNFWIKFYIGDTAMIHLLSVFSLIMFVAIPVTIVMHVLFFKAISLVDRTVSNYVKRFRSDLHYCARMLALIK
jgi:hypothetical protein